MYAEIAMYGRTINAKIDSERYRGPCWVLRAAVKTYLRDVLALLEWDMCSNIGVWSTLFAGLDRSFSKIFIDWDLSAVAMVARVQ